MYHVKGFGDKGFCQRILMALEALGLRIWFKLG